MSLDPVVLVAILGMALVTAFTRVAGFRLVAAMRLSPAVRQLLEAMPGAVLVAVIAPGIIGGGSAGLLAGLITALAAWRLPLLAVVLVGIGAAAALRAVLPA